MERVDDEYYKGFEGEPEIQFICRKGKDSETLIIWEGYFDQIMRLIEPDDDGWKGLKEICEILKYAILNEYEFFINRE